MGFLNLKCSFDSSQEYMKGKNECKVVNLQEWQKKEDEKERQRIIRKIIARGTDPGDKERNVSGEDFKPVA